MAISLALTDSDVLDALHSVSPSVERKLLIYVELTQEMRILIIWSI